ncbi:hypothetical protein ACNKHV_21185 [Shigella flexneri]
MKTFPLQSLTIIKAQQKQLALVDGHLPPFPRQQLLSGGDLRLNAS